MSNNSSDILYGINSVIEALRSGKRKAIRLYISSSRHDKYEDILHKFAKKLSIPLKVVSKQELSKLASTDSHQGIAGVFEPYPYSDFRSMLADTGQPGKKPFIVALDEVQDPHNTGAIIRTASCLGCQGVIITKRRSAYITPAVVKASGGATEFMNITIVTNLRAEIESLKESGLIAVALDMKGRHSFNDVTGQHGFILVIGSEGRGIRLPVLDVCDYIVSIPMEGHTNSLNASVAAGIAIHALGSLR